MPHDESERRTYSTDGGWHQATRPIDEPARGEYSVEATLDKLLPRQKRPSTDAAEAQPIGPCLPDGAFFKRARSWSDGGSGAGERSKPKGRDLYGAAAATNIAANGPTAARTKPQEPRAPPAPHGREKLKITLALSGKKANGSNGWKFKSPAVAAAGFSSDDTGAAAKPPRANLPPPPPPHVYGQHQQPYRPPPLHQQRPQQHAHAHARLPVTLPAHRNGKSPRGQRPTMAGADSTSALGRFLDAEDPDDTIAGAAADADGDAVVDSLTAAGGDTLPGVCVECEDSAGAVICDQCDDVFCKMCFTILHRKGNRKKHTTTAASPGDIRAAEELLEKHGRSAPTAAAASPTHGRASLELGVGSAHARLSPPWFAERCKFIPIRLQLPERKRLRLFVASLAVSDYTGRIDRPNLMKGAKRLHQQMREMCSNFTGLTFSHDDVFARNVLETRDFKEVEGFLSVGYEITRRHKIMNPEKLRTNYGKLVYMLQDSHSEGAQSMLGFSLESDIKTVFDFFDDHQILGILSEHDLSTATMEILPEKKSRHQIQTEIKAKERARERIARKYASQSRAKKDKILWALYSIGDNFSFLNSNRRPIDTMVEYLKAAFSPDKYEEGFCLAISGGVDGARLTHSHSRHYHYVLQSLTLWREINDDMFRLWYLAEQDLLAAGNKYILKDTGQGLQRVQAAPRVLSAMRTILHNCQQRLGEWVGSSVIHLGDDNVPNAMMFVDKYTQVAKILSPIIQTIREIDKLVKDEGLALYIKNGFGGPEQLKKLILYDFFRNAFDGSGADNFFDAGSCIDGRLTSAWNWCATLPDKPFYHVFLLSGFIGFDGEFQE